MLVPGRTTYQELKMPKRKRNVSIFVQQSTTAMLRTEETRQEDDVFLARLSLDRLGLANRALFMFGCLSTLYVSAPWSDITSTVSSRAS
jgi:hypothetical protein